MHAGIRRAINRSISYVKCLNSRQSDLDNHILSIHSQSTLEDLVVQTSQSMKAVHNYKLFAFVIEEDDGLHIWSDPMLNKARLMDIVGKDFPSADICTMRYIAKGESKVINTFFHKPESVLAYDFSDSRRNARMYMIHKKQPTDREKNRVQALIKSFENTLNTILKIRDLEKTVSTDPLTGCYNRRALTDILNHAINNAQRYKRDLSLVMMDIDFFKSINDIYGHLFGDEVLRIVTNEIQGFIRKGDSLARYGGEEFVIVLPETSLDMAVEITHRLKWKIENICFTLPNQAPLKITASYGVSSVSARDDSRSLLSEADAMLYHAKTQGRNCVMPSFDMLPAQKNSRA